jgi:CPA2 family monovalent cation:H+ antiporter-2
VTVALAAVVLVFVVAVRLPGTLARLVFAPHDEVLLLRVLGLTLLVAGLAGLANVSATVGAFLVGVALSGPIAQSAAELLRPLRDLFAAVFFVFFGLQIDPARLIGVLPLAVVLAAVTAATKITTGWWAAGRAGVGRCGRLRAGVALIPRGEFSIVIAGVTTAAAASTTSIDPGYGALVTSYVLLLAVLGPLTVRLLDGRRPGQGHRTPDSSTARGQREQSRRTPHRWQQLRRGGSPRAIPSEGSAG